MLQCAAVVLPLTLLPCVPLELLTLNHSSYGKGATFTFYHHHHSHTLHHHQTHDLLPSPPPPPSGPFIITSSIYIIRHVPRASPQLPESTLTSLAPCPSGAYIAELAGKVTWNPNHWPLWAASSLYHALPPTLPPCLSVTQPSRPTSLRCPSTALGENKGKLIPGGDANRGLFKTVSEIKTTSCEIQPVRGKLRLTLRSISQQLWRRVRGEDTVAGEPSSVPSLPHPHPHPPLLEAVPKTRHQYTHNGVYA